MQEGRGEKDKFLGEAAVKRLRTPVIEETTNEVHTILVYYFVISFSYYCFVLVLKHKYIEF